MGAQLRNFANNLSVSVQIPVDIGVVPITSKMIGFRYILPGATDDVVIGTIKVDTSADLPSVLGTFTDIAVGSTPEGPNKCVAYNTTDDQLFEVHGEDTSSTTVYFTYTPVNETTGATTGGSYGSSAINKTGTGNYHMSLVWGQTTNKYYLFYIDATTNDAYIATGTSAAGFTVIGAVEAGTVDSVCSVKIDADRAFLIWHDSSSQYVKGGIVNLTASPTVANITNIFSTTNARIDLEYEPTTGKALVICYSSTDSEIRAVPISIGTSTTFSVHSASPLSNFIENAMTSPTEFKCSVDTVLKRFIVTVADTAPVTSSPYSGVHQIIEVGPSGNVSIKDVFPMLDTTNNSTSYMHVGANIANTTTNEDLYLLVGAGAASSKLVGECYKFSSDSPGRDLRFSVNRYGKAKRLKFNG